MTKNKKIIIGVSVGFGLIGLAWFLVAKKVNLALNQKVWDDVSDERIKTLHPSIRERVVAFINDAAREGIFLRLTSANRDWEEQARLYAQGRTTPGPIVTNAEPGESTHNYGLGFDVVPMVNGQPVWNSDQWDRIGAIGKSHSFTWGGDWNSFSDRPHFQDTFGNSIASLRTMYLNGQVNNGYLNVA